MMKSLKICLICFTLSLSLLSCETIIDLGDDGIGECLIMNAAIDASDSLHIVWLAKCTQDKIEPVNSATLKCYVNDSFVSRADTVHFTKELFVRGNDELVPGFLLYAKLRSGDKIRIDVEADGLECHSETIVPQIPLISSVDTVWVGRHEIKFEITIRDDAADDNYYMLGAVQLDSVTILQRDTLIYYFDDCDSLTCYRKKIKIDNSNEPLLDSGDSILGGNNISNNVNDNKYNLFTDTSFEGSSVSLNVTGIVKTPAIPEDGYYSGDVFRSTSYALIYLYAITRDTYHYYSGLQFDSSVISGTYLTPSFVYPQNVEGGLGCVLVKNPCIYPVKVFDKILNKENEWR